MSILIGALEFGDPVADFDLLSDEPGIFAILTQADEELELIELSETQLVRSYVQNHQDRDQWIDLGVVVAVHYTGDLDESDRQEITSTLEREFEDVELAA